MIKMRKVFQFNGDVKSMKDWVSFFQDRAVSTI